MPQLIVQLLLSRQHVHALAGPCKGALRHQQIPSPNGRMGIGIRGLLYSVFPLHTTAASLRKCNLYCAGRTNSCQHNLNIRYIGATLRCILMHRGEGEPVKSPAPCVSAAVSKVGRQTGSRQARNTSSTCTAMRSGSQKGGRTISALRPCACAKLCGRCGQAGHLTVDGLRVN